VICPTFGQYFLQILPNFFLAQLIDFPIAIDRISCGLNIFVVNHIEETMVTSLEVREKITELHLKGVRYGAIAKELNHKVTERTMGTIIRQYEKSVIEQQQKSSSSSSEVMTSAVRIAKNIGYNAKELEAVPESSILGVGCGAPVNFTDLKKGEVVVDIGSGGGIDVFLSANKVKDTGKAIGIDMTDEMMEKTRNNAKQFEFRNVEFKKGDIERGIPIDDNASVIALLI
jgi:tRNA/tmRNA/rRNA uracil-C5-methylase (TrmA/RlmC/RlmD family)